VSGIYPERTFVLGVDENGNIVPPAYAADGSQKVVLNGASVDALEEVGFRIP